MLQFPVECVTFYEDRAEVLRSGSTELRAGVQRLTLTGMTPLLVNRSLRIEVLCAGKPLYLRSQVVERVESSRGG